jgi:tetratricopeptide (TPR) repeat protein
MVARLSANLGQCIIICLVFIGQLLFGAEAWTRWTTPNFDFYSTLSRKQNVLLLRQLESARQGLIQLTIADTTGSLPLRVIAFRSQDEYGRYCSNVGSTAYYLHSNYRNYIVISEEASKSVAPEVHEYLHHVIHQRFSHLPLWLDEGIADVYSTLEVNESSLRLGLSLASRQRLLQINGLDYPTAMLWNMRPSYFSNVQHVSPRSSFYAESWLLVHMLKFSPGYAPQFNELLRDLDSGGDPQQVFLQLYNKTPEAVDRDLQNYLKSKRLPTQLLPVHKVDVAFGSTKISPTETHAVLADLLSAMGRFEQARAELSKDAVAVSVNKSSIQEAWGYYYLRQGILTEARKHMTQALQLGTDDPRVIYDAVNLLLSNGAAVEAVVPALEHAIALRPDFQEARSKLDQLRTVQKLTQNFKMRQRES